MSLDSHNEYKLLTDTDEQKLSADVTWHLARGWQLYGNPTACVQGNVVYYGQAVAK